MFSAPPTTTVWMRDEIDRGIYERIEQAWCAELPQGDTVLELGAGIGIVSRVLATRFRRVVSIEANADLMEHWDRNVSLDAAMQVSTATRELRIGMIGGEDLHVAGQEWWKSTGSPHVTTAVGAIATRRVKQLSLAALIAEVQPSAIVCDIEGAEVPALIDVADAAALRRVRDVIVELHPGLWEIKEYGAALANAMKDAGFTVSRDVKADGWPRGVPHPLGISHVWWTR